MFAGDLAAARVIGVSVSARRVLTVHGCRIFRARLGTRAFPANCVLAFLPNGIACGSENIALYCVSYSRESDSSLVVSYDIVRSRGD